MCCNGFVTDTLIGNNSSSPAQNPEYASSLQVSLPHDTLLLWRRRGQHWGPGMNPVVLLHLNLVLKLVGFVRLKQEPSEYFGLVLYLFPPQKVCLVTRLEQRRSLRAVELTQRHNWVLDCTLPRRSGECVDVSFCGVCRSSWNCVWRQRWPGPKTRASCSSLR